MSHTSLRADLPHGSRRAIATKTGSITESVGLSTVVKNSSKTPSVVCSDIFFAIYTEIEPFSGTPNKVNIGVSFLPETTRKTLATWHGHRGKIQFGAGGVLFAVRALYIESTMTLQLSVEQEVKVVAATSAAAL